MSKQFVFKLNLQHNPLKLTNKGMDFRNGRAAVQRSLKEIAAARPLCLSLQCLYVRFPPSPVKLIRGE